ncbi:MAG: DUF2784 domain-containing protein [Betaproteobacteria bacterium]|nr:DUF2784 domain-containing protein [Betaproteobacteria bacterium]
MLADLVLLLHAAFVLFVAGGLVAIWAGAAFDRSWARNPWFRGLHLAAIAFVAVQSALGYACPLTIWEDALRGSADDAGFIQRGVRALLYWNAPGWVFTTVYVAFGAFVAATWWRIPPRRG